MSNMLEHPFIPAFNLPQAAKNLKMLWIPAGRFWMGKHISAYSYDEDTPQFEVVISNGFWMGQFPVTQAQWVTIMKDNPSYFHQDGLNRPVDNINWFQANDFCQVLNQQFVDSLPTHYRFGLPTEAQWEYACRAATTTKYCSGDTSEDLSRAAWHKDNSSNSTQNVGEKSPNNWGLYDVHGNVMEWCEDSPSDYPKSPSVDWVGRGNGNVRSLRGGSWATSPYDTSFPCTGRGYVAPIEARPWFGFRLCLKMVAL